MSILSNLFDRLNKSNSSLIISLLVLGILFYTTYPKDAPQDVKLVAKKGLEILLLFLVKISIISVMVWCFGERQRMEKEVISSKKF